MAFSSEAFDRPKLAGTLPVNIVVDTEANQDDTNDTVRVDFYWANFDGTNDKLLFRAILPISIVGRQAQLKDIKVYHFAGDEANWATGGSTPADSTAENFSGVGTTSPVIGSSKTIDLDAFLTAAGVARTNS